MKCRAFDHTAVDDLDGLPSKCLLWDRVQKSGTILSDVFNSYDSLRRVAEIEATMKQTFIVSCSKQNIFIGPIVTVVWENCLV